MAKKAYIGVENFTPRALPSGYSQVEYIESNGKQYLDTGLKGNQNTRIDADYYTTATVGAIIGADSGWGSNMCTIEVHFAAFATSNYQYTTVPSGRHTVSLNKGVFSLDGTTLSTTSGSFTTPVNLTLFALNRNGSITEYGSIKLYSMRIYDNGTLVRDYVPCINPSGVVGLYDMVNGAFGESATSTAFVAGSSVQSVARKVKKGYVGVDGKARKIKKAYIGIGGVARPCWSGGELAYYGTIDGLSKASRLLAATTIGDYALFGGGADPSVNSVGTVNAYNSSLVKSNPASLSPARYALSATTVGNYAIFGGGRYTSSRLRADTCYFDGSLTYGHVGTSMNKEREYYAATTVGSYALFGGGLVNSAAMRNLDIYDTSLTSHTTTTPLSSGRYYLGATTVGDYALFGGGYNGAASQTTVDAFNKTLTRSTPTAFAYVRYYVAATAVGNYALFAGSLSGASNTVDAYNSSLTRTSATVLSVSRGDMAATTVNGFAVFAGGFGSGGETHETCVDVYDASLTRTTGQSLSTGRGAFAATTVGNYAIFAGGMNLSVGPVSTVEAYTVA